MAHETELQQTRKKLADMITDAVRQTADVIEEEQKNLKDRFPAMAHQPSPILVDPGVIRDFTRSEEYQRAVREYIDGRLEVNLLVKILQMLERVAPMEFFVR